MSSAVDSVQEHETDGASTESDTQRPPEAAEGRHNARRRAPGMTKVLGRVWLPALIVIAVVVGSLTVANLRSVFGSEPVVVTPVGTDTAADFDPKVVVYDVYGSGGTGVINYLDLDGKPQRATGQLPWSLRLTTTNPSASPNILAQSDGQTISCRVTVDGVVKDERTATGMNAQTYCLVKSA